VFVSSIRMTENAGRPISIFRCQPDSRTTVDILDHCAGIFPNGDVFGERAILADGSWGKYLGVSFSQFRAKCLKFAAAVPLNFRELHSRNPFPNCTAWQIASFGCHYCGAVLVPISESINSDTMRHIIEHSECQLLVIHGRQVDLIPHIFKEQPAIPIVVISAVGYDRLITFDNFLQRGESFNQFSPYTPRPLTLPSSFTPAAWTSCPKAVSSPMRTSLLAQPGLHPSGPAFPDLTLTSLFCRLPTSMSLNAS
jgi:hypothetical protein